MRSKEISFILNGKPVTTTFSEGESLTDLLRNLGMTSVKKGCEAGECGACTVLLDGKSINSCIYLADWVEGHDILTLEGVRAKDGSLHPIQQAFIDEAAIQCGFCTPGMIIATYELLSKNPSPSEEDIKVALSGNLCRCTGYVKIIDAVKLAVRKLKNK